MLIVDSLMRPCIYNNTMQRGGVAGGGCPPFSRAARCIYLVLRTDTLRSSPRPTRKRGKRHYKAPFQLNRIVFLLVRFSSFSSRLRFLFLLRPPQPSSTNLYNYPHSILYYCRSPGRAVVCVVTYSTFYCRFLMWLYRHRAFPLRSPPH